MYFKTVVIEDIESQKVEAAIRQFTARRHLRLDFQSAESYITSDKFFLGTENKNAIHITRLRTPFERLLPKLILKFDKEKGFNLYRVRFSLFSNLVFVIIVVSVVLRILSFVSKNELDSDTAAVILFFVIFSIFTLLEWRLTKASLKKAIDKAQKTKP